jgi:predicted MFS family arabinose efflux permease
MFTVAVVILMGAAGLGANPALIAQTLCFAGEDSTLGSSMAMAAFNLGTAAGSALAGATLSTSLGLVGPPTVGAVITTSALVLLAILAATLRRSVAAHPIERHRVTTGG